MRSMICLKIYRPNSASAKKISESGKRDQNAITLLSTRLIALLPPQIKHQIALKQQLNNSCNWPLFERLTNSHSSRLNVASSGISTTFYVINQCKVDQTNRVCNIPRYR